MYDVRIILYFDFRGIIRLLKLLSGGKKKYYEIARGTAGRTIGCWPGIALNGAPFREKATPFCSIHFIGHAVSACITRRKPQQNIFSTIIYVISYYLPIYYCNIVFTIQGTLENVDPILCTPFQLYIFANKIRIATITFYSDKYRIFYNVIYSTGKNYYMLWVKEKKIQFNILIQIIIQLFLIL